MRLRCGKGIVRQQDLVKLPHVWLRDINSRDILRCIDCAVAAYRIIRKRVPMYEVQGGSVLTHSPLRYVTGSIRVLVYAC